MNDSVQAILEAIRKKSDNAAVRLNEENDRYVAMKEKQLVKKEEELRLKYEAIVEEERRHLAEKRNSLLKREERRIKLESMNALIQRFYEEVESSLATLPQSSGYGDILVEWIIEGAAGIGYPDSIIVRTSPTDKGFLTQSLVDKVLDRITALGGDVKTLSVLDDDLIVSAGVVVEDAAHRIAYGNTLSDRIRRCERSFLRILQTAFEAEMANTP